MPETGSAAGARATVLARLWGALGREPIPGIHSRHRDGPTLTVTLDDGRCLRAEAGAAVAFATVPDGFRVELGDEPYHEPGALVRAWAPPGGQRLAAELDNSVANLALARAGQAPPDGGAPAIVRAATQPDPLAFLEQCVVDGHPLHPCCRTRTGLSPDEVLAYAPEHRSVVRLALVDVPPSQWSGPGRPVLPVHPWQRDHVLDRYPFLAPSGRELPGRPLMSLRTVALDRHHHVKTAVDVQMTSAVRTVSPAAIHNGPVLSRLMADLAARTPPLTVLPEPEAGAVLVAGAPERSLAVVHRQVPALPAGDVALPLAVLAAPSPADGRPIAAELATQGFGGDPASLVTALADLILPSLFTLLDLGVALEAHGQNLLVVVRGHRPVRMLYRDFGGVRVSPRRLARHAIDPPPLRGDLVTDDPEVLRTKLLAALTTVLGELVAVLARCTDLDPADGWRRIAEVWRPRREQHADGSAMFAATVPVKATTAMRLADQPLDDRWAAVPNPLAEHA